MSCCAPSLTPFIDADTVTIPYSAQMLQDFGSRPKVQVLLKDSVTGEFVFTQFFVRKALLGYPNTTSVIVYLGGSGTGIIRIQ
jgi:hypothetical protein